MQAWPLTWLESVVHLGAPLYGILAIAAFGESFVLTGLLVPGTVALLFTGSLLSEGMYSAAGLGICALVGAFFGSVLSYEIGRKSAGKHVAQGKHMQRARDFFLRYHGLSIVLSRFVGPIRPFVPFIAGMCNVRRASLYVYSLLGGILWIACYLSIGYALGVLWKQAMPALSLLGFAAVLLAGSIILLHRRLSLQRS